VEIVTSFNNQIRNHKLCAVFDTDIDTDHTVAEGNFSLTRRPIISAPDNMESHPQQSFVTVTDGTTEFSLLNRGLPEFDVCKTEIRTKLSLTLLRCVGTIGPLAGADHPVPAAQCLGPYKAEYAIRVHDGNIIEADIVSSAHAYTVPLWCEGDIQHPGIWPNNGSLIKLQKNLAITALKKSEEDSDIVFRVWNTSSDCREIEVHGIIPFKETWETGMNEVMIQECSKQDDMFFFEVQPNGVATIKANRQSDVLPEETIPPLWDR